MKFKSSKEYFDNIKAWYEINKKPISEDPFIKTFLPLLKEAVEYTRKVFIETGSFAFCAECAKAGEKCCGEGLEWKLSPAEFVLNLKLSEIYNLTLDLYSSKKGDCLFLGEKGCILFLPPLFCRNFFCLNLANFLGHIRLTRIQQVMENEAILSFRLSDYLNRTYLKNLHI